MPKCICKNILIWIYILPVSHISHSFENCPKFVAQEKRWPRKEVINEELKKIKNKKLFWNSIGRFVEGYEKPKEMVGVDLAFSQKIPYSNNMHYTVGLTATVNMKHAPIHISKCMNQPKFGLTPENVAAFYFAFIIPPIFTAEQMQPLQRKGKVFKVCDPLSANK